MRMAGDSFNRTSLIFFGSYLDEGKLKRNLRHNGIFKSIVRFEELDECR